MATITPMEKNQPQKKQIKMPSKKGGTGAKAVSGSGMDRSVEKKQSAWKKYALVGAALLAAGYVFYHVFLSSSGRALSVDQNRIVVSEVISGTFEDFIPVRGRVTTSQDRLSRRH